jgi:hypothetical protein
MGVVIHDLVPHIGEGELAVWYEDIDEKYADRMKHFLNRVKEELGFAAWHTTKPLNISSGEFSIIVSRDITHLRSSQPDDLDVEIHLRVRESSPEKEARGGVTFELIVTSFGGDKITHYCPYDFTNYKWARIDDEEGIEKRFLLVEELHLFRSIVVPLRNWLKGKSA